MSTSSHSYSYPQHSPTPSLVRSPTHSTHSSFSTSRVSNPSSVTRRKRPISPALKVAAWQSSISSSISSDSYPASPQIATHDEPEPQAPVQMRDVNLIPDYIIVARCLGETVDEDYQFSHPPSSFHDPSSSRNSTATDPRSSYFSDPRSSYFSMPPSDLDLDEQQENGEGEAVELEGVQEEEDDAADENDDAEPEGIFVPRFIKNQRQSHEQQRQEAWGRDRDEGDLEEEEESVAVAIRSEGRGLTNSVDIGVQSPTTAATLKKSKHKFTKSSGTHIPLLSFWDKL
jgi:hypothetical protein